MTNKRKWTAMLLGVCILLSLLTACAPAGTSVGSSSVPEAASSVPATSSETVTTSGSDTSSARGTVQKPTGAVTSSAVRIDPETGETLPDDPYEVGYRSQFMPDLDYLEEMRAWMGYSIAWLNPGYTKTTYNEELCAIHPETDGPILYRQETVHSVPEIVCELPLYERIVDAKYCNRVEGKEKPVIYILTKRSQVYCYDENTGELVHLFELPSEEEDILSWTADPISGSVTVRAATEETYRLWVELESRRGETIPQEEQVYLLKEIYFSYDIYSMDLETGEQTQMTKEEYQSGFEQIIP